MIFQSQVASTTKQSKFNGAMAAVAFHALILAIILFVTIPKPEEKLMDPFVTISFGDPDMGGGSDMAAGASSPVDNPDPGNPDQSTTAAASATEENDQSEAIEKANPNPTKTSKPTTTKPERQSDKASEFKKGGKKGNKGKNGSDPNGGDDGLGPDKGDYGNRGEDYTDNDGVLKPKFQPKRLGKKEIDGENTNDPNPKKVSLIATVNCNGVITQLDLISSRSTDSKSLILLQKKLIGQAYYSPIPIPDCKGSGKMLLEVTINPR
ncbi:MAG: hypothetical protein EXR21_08700 [Flavobacteriaceae bacterium]|nr:hypothetical protein [Flavobacteriaceae bacterium]